MGFLSGIWEGIKSIGKTIFGDHSSSTTTTNTHTSSVQTIYEPDKVKVAELENARMERAVEAQKELIQMNAEMQMMIIEAQKKGFEESVNLLKEMMINLNKIAQERLLLIENGHFEVVEKIENLYLELEKEIRKDHDNFNITYLPQMLDILNRFEPGSESAKLYSKSIDKQIELNGSFFSKKLEALHQRQKLMVESAIASKQQILEQSSQIVLDRMKFLEEQLKHQQTIQLQNQHPTLNSTKEKDVEVKLIEE